MNSAIDALKPLTFLWIGEYRQRIEYPSLSAFICG